MDRYTEGVRYDLQIRAFCWDLQITEMGEGKEMGIESSFRGMFSLLFLLFSSSRDSIQRVINAGWS
jgi:hypothetical protein